MSIYSKAKQSKANQMFRIEKPRPGIFSPYIITHEQVDEKEEPTVEALEKQVHQAQPMIRKQSHRRCGEKLLKKIAKKQKHKRKGKQKRKQNPKITKKQNPKTKRQALSNPKITKKKIKKLSKHMSSILSEF